MKKNFFVLDTSVCIDIWNGGLISELLRLPYNFLIPDVIIAELINPEGAVFPEAGFRVLVTDASGVHVVSALSKRYPELSVRDVFALSSAKVNGYTLLTGDDALRRAASNEDVEMHGVLWLLDELVSKSVISKHEAVIALRNILEAGSWLPKKECQQRFIQWGKMI